MTAPDTFRVKFETSKGEFVVDVHRDWAPNGADRFYYLVRNGFYDGVRFFRVLPGFIAQFGISGDPKLSLVWRKQAMYDDTLVQSNKRGFMSFVASGPGRRSTQVFINLADNPHLDTLYVPFARVVAGMDVVDRLYAGYGDPGPGRRAPDQERIRKEGNAYLTREFPRLDYGKRATVIEP
jgi:peptidyl-prolyl cis-trans isomerase A (cyclophilin A)